MAEKGVRQADIVAATGELKQSVNKLYKGTTAMSKQWAERLAPVLGIPWPEIMGWDAAGSDASVLAPDPLPPPNVRPAPDVQLPAPGQMPRDLQVWGSAEGGPDGAFELRPASSFGYVDLIRRPPGLVGVRDAFALYVVGESMSPWKEPGEALYINPGRQAQLGNYVVVVLRSLEPDDNAPMRAMVKRLTGRTARHLQLEQFNPAKTFEIARVEVVHTWRVMDQAEVLGFV